MKKAESGFPGTRRPHADRISFPRLDALVVFGILGFSFAWVYLRSGEDLVDLVISGFGFLVSLAACFVCLGKKS